MRFKPPYWYHDNVEFSDDEIQKLKIELSSLKSGNHLYYSSFFMKENERPDKVHNNRYCKIVEDILKNLGLYYTTACSYTYWSQLYKKGMTHRPHHHAHTDPEKGANISWVHFLDVPEQKCFRFTDKKGNTLVPDEQNNGDIICFPSWIWHEVVPNETDKQRLVVAGNIRFTYYDD